MSILWKLWRCLTPPQPDHWTAVLPGGVGRTGVISLGATGQACSAWVSWATGDLRAEKVSQLMWPSISLGQCIFLFPLGKPRAFAQAQLHLHQCWWSAEPRTGQRPAWCSCPGVGAGGCLCQGDWQGGICWHPDCDAEHFWAPHRHAEMWKMVTHANNSSGQNMLPGTKRQPNAWTFVFTTPLHKISPWRLRECFPQRQRAAGQWLPSLMGLWGSLGCVMAGGNEEGSG